MTSSYYLRQCWPITNVVHLHQTQIKCSIYYSLKLLWRLCLRKLQPHPPYAHGLMMRNPTYFYAKAWRGKDLCITRVSSQRHATNRPISQFPRCISQISQYAPFCSGKHMRTFLLQNTALWDMALDHCGICDTTVGTFITVVNYINPANGWDRAIWLILSYICSITNGCRWLHNFEAFHGLPTECYNIIPLITKWHGEKIFIFRLLDVKVCFFRQNPICVKREGRKWIKYIVSTKLFRR